MSDVISLIIHKRNYAIPPTQSFLNTGKLHTTLTSATVPSYASGHLGRPAALRGRSDEKFISVRSMWQSNQLGKETH